MAIVYPAMALRTLNSNCWDDVPHSHNQRGVRLGGTDSSLFTGIPSEQAQLPTHRNTLGPRR